MSLADARRARLFSELNSIRSRINPGGGLGATEDNASPPPLIRQLVSIYSHLAMIDNTRRCEQEARAAVPDGSALVLES